MKDGSHTHDDGVARRAQGVRYTALLLAADPPRVSTRRGDPAVERLRVLDDDVRLRLGGSHGSEESPDVGRTMDVVDDRGGDDVR